ncbi:hypothetical protein BC829DRAFT_301499 [Chytridium lagenaria]|nr:hypothetical protein BC829DRAFT_301499 [Chytridium lagenaria]
MAVIPFLLVLVAPSFLLQGVSALEWVGTNDARFPKQDVPVVSSTAPASLSTSIPTVPFSSAYNPTSTINPSPSSIASPSFIASSSESSIASSPTTLLTATVTTITTYTASSSAPPAATTETASPAYTNVSSPPPITPKTASPDLIVNAAPRFASGVILTVLAMMVTAALF